SSAGVQGDDLSSVPSLSADGRFVVFDSHATNLVTGDGNGVEDVFVRDTQAGTTTRVSVSTAGDESNGTSGARRISAAGRWVTFYSASTNLVAGDANGQRDVFLCYLHTGTTTLISVSTAGDEGNAKSTGPAISGDGRFVAYNSLANNLVADDTNGLEDVFV